ncbi:ComF family protein [Yoonia algicola]|uniref:ComF family protein n=1 Tax=Yoonia algicola TaxID=3137368 RepID=A0AAN0NGN9_9RHOB
MRLQSVIRAIYPAQCVACDASTEDDFGLCAACWRETQFIGGLVCDKCGVPLPGEDHGETVQCDDCMTIARPWDRGRTVLAYSGVGRRLVLALKHGDRTELAIPAARWMAQKIQDWGGIDTVFVPVPLHWLRLVRRRYNQSALLAQELAKVMDTTVCVDALVRTKRTATLQGHSRDARFAELEDAIVPNPKCKHHIASKHVILVDDVMTSGATLAASAEAAKIAGARKVSIVTLARVVKDA